MVKCKECRRNMQTAESCLPTPWHHGGERIPFGSEPGQELDLPPGVRCHDCNVAVGGYHHHLCDFERCPICLDQALYCEHSAVEHPWDDGDYRLSDVVELTGAKRSQIENWCRSGWLIPEGGASAGTGDHRLFSFRNLVDVAIGVRLSRFHIPVRTLLRDLERDTLRALLPDMSGIDVMSDDQLVAWYTEGWTDDDWHTFCANDGNPISRDQAVTEAIIGRHRRGAQEWRDALNPARRPDDAYQAIVIYNADGKYIVNWHSQASRGVHDCAFVINVVTILEELEDLTGDQWQDWRAAPPLALKKLTT